MEQQAEEAQQQGGQVARIVAAGAVVLGCVFVALVLLTAGDPYTIKMRFQTAANVVKGNLVQSAGRPVGTVQKVELLDSGEAQLTLELNDTVAPLREGTTATIRQRSQSGSASKYVEL